MTRRRGRSLVRVLPLVVLAGCSSGAALRQPEEPPLDGPAPLVLPPASVQPGGPEHASAGEATPPRATELSLDLDRAVVMALAGNPSLEVARYGPLLDDTVIREERARFDPTLAGSLRWSDDTRQLSAVQRFTFSPDDGGTQPQGPLLLNRKDLNLSTSLSTLLPTGTELSLTAAVDRSSTNFTPREYEGSWTLQLLQPLLEGAGDRVATVAVRQAENRAVQSRWDLRTTVLDVVAAAERAYWDLVRARQVVEIRAFAVRLAREQLELNQDLVDTGKAVRSAVLSARAEMRTREAGLADARGRVRTATVTLLRLLQPEGVAPDADVLTVDDPVVKRVKPDVEAAVARALDQRPEIVRERIETRNRHLDVVTAIDRAQPALDLVAGYGRTSLGLELGGAFDHLVDDTPYDQVTLGLDLELPVSRRGDRARLERARIAERRARARVAELESTVDEEVRRAAIAVESQWERVEASREAVEARQEELRIEHDRYQVGMARNLDVLLIQRLLIEARVADVEARIAYLEALLDLYRADGTLLERRGVALAGPP